MQTLVTHPDNVAWFERIIRQVDLVAGNLGMFAGPLWPSIRVQANRNCPKEEPTGRVIHPDGQAVDRADFTWEVDRFVTCDEKSLPWLIRLGVIAEEMQLHFYLVDDSVLRFRMCDYPVIVPPRSVCFTTFA